MRFTGNLYEKAPVSCRYHHTNDQKAIIRLPFIRRVQTEIATMQAEFSAYDYPPSIARLVDPKLPATVAVDYLNCLDFEAAVAPHPVVDVEMARACTSGLWLKHDFLDRSHEISQRIASATGSFWHGIMHRGEGDFSNAKYWFRKVGEHPIFPSLAAAAHAIDADQFTDSRRWDPYHFVDRCAAVADQAAPDALLREVAAAEWDLLFAHCFKQAIGSS